MMANWVALIGHGRAGSNFHASLIEACPTLATRLAVSRDAAQASSRQPLIKVVVACHNRR